MCEGLTVYFAAASALATVAGTAYTMMQKQQTADYDAQMYEMQREQQREMAKNRELQMQEEINERKRIALREAKSNKATLAGTNIDLGSPSFGAFLQSNREAEKRDISNLRLMGLQDQYALQMGARQSGLAAKSVREKAKSSRMATLLGGVADTAGTLGSIDWG